MTFGQIHICKKISSFFNFPFTYFLKIISANYIFVKKMKFFEVKFQKKMTTLLYKIKNMFDEKKT